MHKFLTLYTIPLMLVSLLLLGACLPDPLEVKGIPHIKPEIVVSTQVLSDGSLVILLTKSFGALDASSDSDAEEVLSQIAVNDAFVTISSTSRTDTMLFLGDGFYGGRIIPFTADDTYSLYVNSESLGVITAVTSVKSRIRFEDIYASLYFDGFDDTLARVSYTFQDLPEKNWYMLNVFKVERDEVEENLLNPRMFTRLLDDTDFSGQVYAETFRVFPTEFRQGDTLAVYLSNISEEYNQFMQMREDNRFSLIEYLSEPVNYPSNVQGGKGFFNLYIPDIRFFVLE